MNINGENQCGLSQSRSTKAIKFPNYVFQPVLHEVLNYYPLLTFLPDIQHLWTSGCGQKCWDDLCFTT